MAAAGAGAKGEDVAVQQFEAVGLEGERGVFAAAAAAGPPPHELVGRQGGGQFVELGVFAFLETDQVRIPIEHDADGHLAARGRLVGVVPGVVAVRRRGVAQVEGHDADGGFRAGGGGATRSRSRAQQRRGDQPDARNSHRGSERESTTD